MGFELKKGTDADCRLWCLPLTPETTSSSKRQEGRMEVGRLITAAEGMERESCGDQENDCQEAFRTQLWDGEEEFVVESFSSVKIFWSSALRQLQSRVLALAPTLLSPCAFVGIRSISVSGLHSLSGLSSFYLLGWRLALCSHPKA